MRKIDLNVLVIFFFISSCSMQKAREVETIDSQNAKMIVGKTITVTGKAINVKNGAFLMLENGFIIWMNDIDSWPAGYYEGEGKSKTLKVTGKLIEKNDLPIIIEGSEIKIQGIPVSKETNREAASHRYLLNNAKWEVIAE